MCKDLALPPRPLLLVLVGSALAVAALPLPAATLAESLRQASEEGGHLLLAFASPLASGSEAAVAALPPRMHEGLPSPVSLLALDPYDGAEGSALARRFNLVALPAFVLVDAAGSEVDRMAQPPARRALAELLAGRGDLARRRQAARERPSDHEAALALGRELLGRGDLDGAFPHLQRASREGEPPLAARARHGLALLHLRRGEVEAAVAMLEALEREEPESAAATEAPIARAQILFVRGEAPEAARVLERFRLGHPGHPRDAEVAALLARIRDATAAAAMTPSAAGR